MYSFEEKFREGQRHEATLDDHFRKLGFKVRPATRAEQRQGIDRWIDGHAVEYKADTTASRTGNCFVETVSVDTENKAGWAHTSRAKYLVYYLPVDELAYLIPFARLREQLPRWERECETRRIPNRGYHTIGLLVPLEELEPIKLSIYDGVGDHGTH